MDDPDALSFDDLLEESRNTVYDPYGEALEEDNDNPANPLGRFRTPNIPDYPTLDTDLDPTEMYHEWQ